LGVIEFVMDREFDVRLDSLAGRNMADSDEPCRPSPETSPAAANPGDRRAGWNLRGACRKNASPVAISCWLRNFPFSFIE
jgi:hypothetical protein